MPQLPTTLSVSIDSPNLFTEQHSSDPPICQLVFEVLDKSIKRINTFNVQVCLSELDTNLSDYCVAGFPLFPDFRRAGKSIYTLRWADKSNFL